LSGAKQTTLESKPERGPGGDPLRPVPGVRSARSRGPRAVRTARSWRDIVAFTHPRTGGAHDSHHRTAGIAGRTRRCGSRVAARGTRAATGDARGRLPPERGAWSFRLVSGRAPPSTERDRPRRGTKLHNRIPLGRGQL